MASDEALEAYDKFLKVRTIRWYNLSYVPACKKLQETGKISKYKLDQLLEPNKHLERQRIPSPFSLHDAVKLWNKN